jgi:hypothetical protein
MKLTKTHYIIGAVAIAGIAYWWFNVRNPKQIPTSQTVSSSMRPGKDGKCPDGKYPASIGIAGGLCVGGKGIDSEPLVVSAATLNTEAQKKAEAQEMIDAMKTMRFKSVVDMSNYEASIMIKTGYNNINGKAVKAVIYT